MAVTKCKVLIDSDDHVPGLTVNIYHQRDNHRTHWLLSVSYEDTELLFHWKKEGGNKEVVVSDELEIPQFILTKHWTESTFSNFTSGTLQWPPAPLAYWPKRTRGSRVEDKLV